MTTVFGIDYLDCSCLNIVNHFYQKQNHDAFGNVLNVHGNHISLTIFYLKVNAEYTYSWILSLYKIVYQFSNSFVV